MIVSIFILGLGLGGYLVFKYFRNKKRYWWNK